MKQVYEIHSVKMVVQYNNDLIHDDGSIEHRTEQTFEHEGLYTKEQLFDLMKAKVAPGEEFEIKIADGVEI